jgi:predicted alpha/beta hydrolase
MTIADGMPKLPEGVMDGITNVIPAQAGSQSLQQVLDPGFRRGDGLRGDDGIVRGDDDVLRQAQDVVAQARDDLVVDAMLLAEPPQVRGEGSKFPQVPPCYKDAHEAVLGGLFATLENARRSLAPHAAKVALRLFGIFDFYSERFHEWYMARHNPLAVVRPTPEMVADAHKSTTFSLGVSRPKFGTTVYHYPFTPEEHLKGFPEIGADSVAVVIAFGGSGVTSASGRSFMRFAKQFKDSGVSIISLDYPYHAGGPYDPRYLQIGVSMGMFGNVVEHYGSSGIPLYVVGHSMGPAIIQDLLEESPRIARGASMFSTGGPSSRELLDHYRLQLATGALDFVFSEVTRMDPEGQMWETAMDNQMRTLDIGRMRTEIPVWFISGEFDPWSTPQLLEDLAQKYPNATVEIIPSEGHHIFNVYEGKKNLMVARVLGMIEYTEGRKLPVFASKKEIAPGSMVYYLYDNSELFRNWYAEVEKRPIGVFIGNRYAAEDLLARYEFWQRTSLFAFARQYLPGVINYPVDKTIEGAKQMVQEGAFDVGTDGILQILAAIRRSVEMMTSGD